MPRKRALHTENYDKALPTALRGLFNERDYTHQDLAEYLGKTRQTVSCYCGGTSSPDWETIVKIADFFSVSTDYLLGRSDVASQREDIQVSHITTGLSEKAVSYLHKVNEISKLPPTSRRLNILSDLLERRQFDLLLALMERYVRLMRTIPSLEYSTSADYIFCVDELKKHGYEVALPDEQAQALFSERIINILRGLLDDIADGENCDAKKKATGGNR